MTFWLSIRNISSDGRTKSFLMFCKKPQIPKWSISSVPSVSYKKSQVIRQLCYILGSLELGMTNMHINSLTHEYNPCVSSVDRHRSFLSRFFHVQFQALDLHFQRASLLPTAACCRCLLLSAACLFITGRGYDGVLSNSPTTNSMVQTGFPKMDTRESIYGCDNIRSPEVAWCKTMSSRWV